MTIRGEKGGLDFMSDSDKLHQRFDALIQEISNAFKDGKLSMLEVFHIIKRAIECLNVLSSLGSLLEQSKQDKN